MLASNIEDTDSDFLSSSAPSEGAQLMTDKLLHMVDGNIPERSVSIRKTTHLWLTQHGEDAVTRKHEARGTERKADPARECSEMFVRKIATELAEAKPASKNWLSKVRKLMNRKRRVSNIPAGEV